jgi:hypothetical protein
MDKKKKNILCVVGSRNQTSQLHQISQYLTDEYDVYYTQLFGDGFFYKLIAEAGFIDNTVLGRDSSFTKSSQEYIKLNHLEYDYRGITKNVKYDLAFLSTDMLIPTSMSKIKTIWIQEGMIDPINNFAKLVKRIGLPTYFTANTSLNGTSNKADIFCSMSHGYKNYFSEHGTSKDKILVTGIPNFDNIDALKKTMYHESGYLLVATSDIRELGGNDDRYFLINKCIEIAKGKKIIFKPHPNENLERVKNEIYAQIPDATIITEPIIDELIANCHTLVTQYSSCVYIGMILGKTVYSYFPMDDLSSKKPIQNGGQSAKYISEIAREFLEFEGNKSDFLNRSDLAKKYL